jgi:hypothetical protein
MNKKRLPRYPCAVCAKPISRRTYCSRACFQIVNLRHDTMGRCLDGQGYVTVYMPSHPRSSSIGRVKEHTLVAEKALGRYLPQGVLVHHHDEVRTHNENWNLVICENSAYHGILHARMRLIGLGADPNTESWCRACESAKPLAAFCKRRQSWNGRSTCCKACS